MRMVHRVALTAAYRTTLFSFIGFTRARNAVSGSATSVLDAPTTALTPATSEQVPLEKRRNRIDPLPLA